MSEPRFAEVAVGLPVHTTFHYKIPRKLQAQLHVGERVRVPFHNRQILGIVVGLVDRTEFERIKPITELIDEHPIMDADLLEVTRWMASTYHAAWGETIQTALPGPLRRGKTTMRSRVEEVPVVHPRTGPHSLTAEQSAAVDAVTGAAGHRVFLLYGITGSGKTEVYLQAIERLLAKGKSSIVLVPEIALTPQAIERFEGRFGAERIAVLHSGMLESRRLREWNRIRSGEACVVVGARSAVFAPVQSLGLIVIDEEHEPSYKQDEDPRYHAREVAIQRARIAGTPVVLGSATPAIETFHQALQGKFTLLRLRTRIDEVPLPEVEIVDMREELSVGRKGRIFSRRLEEALAQTLQKLRCWQGQGYYFAQAMPEQAAYDYWRARWNFETV